MQLSVQEKRDLDKYTRFLALKCAQIIVQSRVGEKVRTSCKTENTGNDWFTLNINDEPGVLTETKRALNGDIISSSIPLCVEISLQTPDGDRMVLEAWCLGLLPDQCEASMHIIHAVYNRMGILLRSLVSVTRVTPAYKLSRRQGPDSFVLFYRIYMGDPQLQALGDDHKEVRIGQICTPIGTLQLSVNYRITMTLSPKQSHAKQMVTNKRAVMEKQILNGDQNEDSCGIRMTQRSSKIPDDVCDLTKPMRLAFAKPLLKREVPKQLPGVERLLAMAAYRHPMKPKTSGNDENHAPDTNLDKIASPTNANPDEPSDNNGNNRMFNQSPIVDNLEKRWTIEEIKALKGDELYKKADEVLSKPLIAAFARPNENCKLLTFYRQCLQNPPLSTVTEKSMSSDEYGKMLESFEAKMPEFNSVVESIQTDDESTSSIRNYVAPITNNTVTRQSSTGLIMSSSPKGKTGSKN